MIQFISSTSWLDDCVGHFKWKFMSKSSMFNYFPCWLMMVTVHSYEVQIKPVLIYQQRSLVADKIFDFQVSWSLAAHLSTCLKETFILILSPFIDKLYVVITSLRDDEDFAILKSSVIILVFYEKINIQLKFIGFWVF